MCAVSNIYVMLVMYVCMYVVSNVCMCYNQELPHSVDNCWGWIIYLVDSGYIAKNISVV